MPQAVPFNINYFRPYVHQKGRDFNDVLTECSGWPEKSDARKVRIAGNTLRLAHLTFAGGIWRGDIHYIDFAKGAYKGSEDGDISPVNLNPEEGMLDGAAFVHDPVLNVLAVERRAVGPTLTRFARFFEKSEAMTSRLSLEPVLKSDAYAQFQKLSRVTRAHLRIAGGLRGQALGSAPSAVKGGLEAAYAAGSPEIEIQFSVGRKFRSQELDTSAIKRAWNWLLRQNAEGDLNVTTLKITGSEEGSVATQYLDLIEERMQDRVNLVPNDDRVVTYDTRVAALVASFQEKRDVLESIFRT